MRENLWFVALAFAVVSSQSIRAGETMNDLERGFKAEFPAACEQYMANLRRYQCQAESITKDLRKGTILLKQATVSRQLEHSGLFIVTPDAESKVNVSEEARVVNSRYVFVVTRKLGQKEWVLHDFYDAANGLPPSIYYYSLDEMVRGFTPFWIDVREWLLDAIKTPEFIIRDAVRRNENGREFVRIDYEHKRPNQRITNSGYFVFDPDRSWLVTERENTISTGTASMTTQFRYEYSDDHGLALMSRMIYRKTSPKVPVAEAESTVTYQFTREEAKRSEFTLSSFGLPEPVGIESTRRTPTYLWILAAGTAFALLAAGAYRLARRQRTRAEKIL